MRRRQSFDLKGKDEFAAEGVAKQHNERGESPGRAPFRRQVVVGPAAVIPRRHSEDLEDRLDEETQAHR
ncbi:unnamed protein product [Linum trigynum]|uniref:Uncharacterized protein n=1 Tax=Linum trigynum TaxID=586398 RepID=A0AAV2GJ49_9ROSI